MQDRTHLRVQREASVWHSLGQHPRVVELLGYAVVDGNPCLISPWSKNGNVYQYLKKNPDADRRALVSPSTENPAFSVINSTLPLVRFSMWQRVSCICIPANRPSFMLISKG